MPRSATRRPYPLPWTLVPRVTHSITSSSTNSSHLTTTTTTSISTSTNITTTITTQCRCPCLAAQPPMRGTIQSEERTQARTGSWQVTGGLTVMSQHAQTAYLLKRPPASWKGWQRQACSLHCCLSLPPVWSSMSTDEDVLVNEDSSNLAMCRL